MSVTCHPRGNSPRWRSWDIFCCGKEFREANWNFTPPCWCGMWGSVVSKIIQQTTIIRIIKIGIFAVAASCFCAHPHNWRTKESCVNPASRFNRNTLPTIMVTLDGMAPLDDHCPNTKLVANLHFQFSAGCASHEPTKFPSSIHAQTVHVWN